MPVDLNLTVPNAGNVGGNAANPLGLVGNVLGIAGQVQGLGIQQQQLQLIQRQMAARQRLGEILSSAPSLDEGMATAMQDPAAPYYTQEFGQIREGMLANQQYQNEVQKAATDGYEVVLKAAASAAASGGDKNAVANAIDSGLKTLSPTVRARDQDAVQSVMKSWTNNLPPDTAQNPNAQRNALNAKIMGWAAAHGMSKESIAAATGYTPSTIDIGSGIQPVVTVGPQGGPQGQAPGTVQPVGQAIPKGLAPVYAETAAGGRVAYPGVSPGDFAPSPLAPAGNSGEGVPTTIAGDGKPLIANPASLATTQFDSRGLPIGGPVTTAGAAERIKSFEGDDLRQYNLVQNGMARATEIDQALDNLAKGGGWQVPGAMGNFRNSMAGFANTFAQITGSKLPFDPNKVSSWEQFNKDSMPAALAMLTQNLGQQREAAQTIQSIMKSVPTIENTFLGGKLVNASMKAMFQRSIDERQFIDYARQQNGGDIQGAEIQFNKEHPAQQYAENVLTQFGLVPGPHGAHFPDLPSVVKAWKEGLLTKEQAKAIGADMIQPSSKGQ